MKLIYYNDRQEFITKIALSQSRLEFVTQKAALFQSRVSHKRPLCFNLEFVTQKAALSQSRLEFVTVA